MCIRDRVLVGSPLEIREDVYKRQGVLPDNVVVSFDHLFNNILHKHNQYSFIYDGMSS